MQNQNVYFGGKLISAEGNAVAVDRLGSVRWNAASGGHTYYPYGVEYSATTNDTEKYATYTRDTLTGLDYAMSGRLLADGDFRLEGENRAATQSELHPSTTGAMAEGA
jgi:hypothetical protein